MTKKTGSLLLIAFTTIAFSGVVSASSPGAQRPARVGQLTTQEVGKSGLLVEIYSDGELFTRHTLVASPPDQSVYSYSIYRVSKEQVVRTSEGDRVFAYQILPSLKGDAASIEVLALLEDPDTVSEANPMDRIKKRPLASYVARAGQAIKVSEMSRLGTKPLEIKVSAVEVKGRNSR